MAAYARFLDHQYSLFGPGKMGFRHVLQAAKINEVRTVALDTETIRTTEAANAGFHSYRVQYMNYVSAKIIEKEAGLDGGFVSLTGNAHIGLVKEGNSTDLYWGARPAQVESPKWWSWKGLVGTLPRLLHGGPKNEDANIEPGISGLDRLCGAVSLNILEPEPDYPIGLTGNYNKTYSRKNLTTDYLLVMKP